MSNGRDPLEARVARLERLLDQVLGLVQEMKAEAGEPAEELPEPPAEVPWEAVEAELAAAALQLEAEELDESREGPSEGTPGAPPGEESHKGPWEPPREKGMGAGLSFRTELTATLAFLDKVGIYPLRGVFLARTGIVLLLLSVAYFFKYSIDQGWLTPAIRLAMGVAAGIGLVAMGFKGASKGEPLGTALAGGGIATFFITGYTGHQWYSLVSYPVAFAFLLGASVLGISLSLRSGLQALALVGLIGALSTPLILTSPTPDVVGLALYVSLIVASVGAIYLLKAWRALLISAALITWPVLWLAVNGASQSQGASAGVVQGVLIFCGLTFWLVPLYRPLLRAQDPHRWPRPPGAHDEIRWRSQGGWSIHLDALSFLMPLTAITLTGWLWDLTRFQLGWVFLGTGLLAQGVGWWLSRTPDPEDSAPTQWFVALTLLTMGLALVFSGQVLYLAFIAEAVALFWMANRRGSRLLFGFGVAVQILVLMAFILRLGGSTLFGSSEPDSPFWLPDLAAIGAAVYIGARLVSEEARKIFHVGAYLGALILLGRELDGYPTLLYLAFVTTAIVTQVMASRSKSSFWAAVGHVPMLLAFVNFSTGIESGRNLLGGDWASFVDLAGIGGAAYIGTLLKQGQGKAFYLFGAYLFFLIWVARELYPLEQGQALMSFAFGVQGTAALVAGFLFDRPALQKLGVGTLLLVVAKVLLVDMAAVEPIWRVMLLFVFGGLFLLLSKFVQGRGPGRSEDEGGETG